MNNKWQFMNHFIREQPFVVHGLFMKMFMNQFMTSAKFHESSGL